MTEIDVRKAVDSDRTDIIAINRVAWENAYQHIYTDEEIADLFAERITQGGTWTTRRRSQLETFVAEIGASGAVIGFVGTTLLKRAGEGEITHLYVHPDYQRQGVGRLLWDTGVAFLKSKNCKMIWVWVLEKAPAYRFYLYQGCEVRENGVYRIGTHREVTKGCVLTFNG